MQQLELGSGFKLSKGQDRLGPALSGAVMHSGHQQTPGLSGWDPQVRWASWGSHEGVDSLLNSSRRAEQDQCCLAGVHRLMFDGCKSLWSIRVLWIPQTGAGTWTEQWEEEGCAEHQNLTKTPKGMGAAKWVGMVVLAYKIHFTLSPAQPAPCCPPRGQHPFPQLPVLLPALLSAWEPLLLGELPRESSTPP